MTGPLALPAGIGDRRHRRDRRGRPHLNQIREAHVLKIGTEGYTSDSARKIDVRR